MLEKMYLYIIRLLNKMYKSLKEGDVVEFTLIDTSKGKQAVQVKEVELTRV